MTDQFMYLASPYTHSDPLVREHRYLAASSALRTLLLNRVWTYSPIVHCHELAKLWGMPTDAEFWKEYDAAMVRASKGLYVLRLEGWHESKGVQGEIDLAISLGKSITYLSPGGLLDAASAVTLNTDWPRTPAA